MNFSLVFEGISAFVEKQYGIKLKTAFKYNPRDEEQLQKLDRTLFQRSTKRRIGERKISLFVCFSVWIVHNVDILGICSPLLAVDPLSVSVCGLDSRNLHDLRQHHTLPKSHVNTLLKIPSLHFIFYDYVEMAGNDLNFFRWEFSCVSNLFSYFPELTLSIFVDNYVNDTAIRDSEVSEK